MGLYKRGKVWWLSITYNDRRVRMSTKTTDKKLADKIYAKVITQITEGRWFDTQGMSTKTFSQLITWYLKKHSEMKLSHERDISSSKNLLRFFGDRKLDAVAGLFSAYIEYRRRGKASPCSINRELSLAKRAYNLAIKDQNEWRFVRENPVKNVEMEVEPASRDRWITWEEENALLSTSPQWLQDLIVFAVETGFRQDKMLSLTWKNVDLFRGTVTTITYKVIQGRKRGSHRTVPLTEKALLLLREKAKVRMIKSVLVFPHDSGQKRSRHTVSDTFKNACKKAGIEELRFHDLRHTYATRLAQSGVDIYTIQKLLGHKSAATTQRYAHHCVGSLRRGIDQFERVRKEGSGKDLSQFCHSDEKPNRSFLSQDITNR